MSGEWRARIVEEPIPDRARVVVWRNLTDTIEYLAGFTNDGMAIFHRQPPEVATDLRTLPALPMDVIRAIAAAVRPGPSEAEMALVREALVVERARVDRVLSAHIEGGEG